MLQGLIIHNNKAVCPRCNGNDFLHMSVVQPINKLIIVCDECEAMWSYNTTSINNNNFEDFTTYVQRLEYTYDEVSLSESNYDWYNKHEIKNH